MWEHIAQKANALNIIKTAAQCENRYKTVLKRRLSKRIIIRNKVLLVERFNSTMKFAKNILIFEKRLNRR